MADHFHIDSLDKKIIAFLAKDARMAFTEIGRKCKVSGAAIHQRVQLLKKNKVITGSQVNVNPRGLGYTTCAYIGIQVNLITGKSHGEVFTKISQIPEIVECHHISGKYSLFVKIHTKDNEHLKNIIIEKIQSIHEVTGTETFISLQEGFIRQLIAG